MEWSGALTWEQKFVAVTVSWACAAPAQQACITWSCILRAIAFSKFAHIEKKQFELDYQLPRAGFSSSCLFMTSGPWIATAVVDCLVGSVLACCGQVNHDARHAVRCWWWPEVSPFCTML